MCRSALASTCTSLFLAAAAMAGDSPPDPARVVSLELEASLVKKPQVYLVLDPPRRALEVRSRGHVLDVITLAGIEVVTQQPLLGAGTPPVVPIPAIWTVKSGPGDADREIIAPDSLRPMPKEGEEEEEAPPHRRPPDRRRRPLPCPSLRPRIGRGSTPGGTSGSAKRCPPAVPGPVSPPRSVTAGFACAARVRTYRRPLRWR